MNRRQILQASAAMVVSLGHSASSQSAVASTSTRTIIKPRRLRKGDTIGLIAPASNATEDEGIRFSIDLIRSLGFNVKTGEHLYDRTQYLAGSDRNRADDVNQMFADEDVDAIFSLRGGYGTPRILPYLNYDSIKANPKVFLGYSDISGILMAIYTKTGLVGFHGPIAQQNFSQYTLAEFKKILMHPSASSVIGAAPIFDATEGQVQKENRLTHVAGGIASGRLVGGNLTLVCSLIGTEYEPDFRDKILFLEDVGEAPYRIDRLLTQLWLAGKLQQVAGIAFGKFTKTTTTGNTFSVEEVIRDRCAGLGVPVVLGFMIGHVNDQTVVPIGINAELDGDQGKLSLLEAAVV